MAECRVFHEWERERSLSLRNWGVIYWNFIDELGWEITWKEESLQLSQCLISSMIFPPRKLLNG